MAINVEIQRNNNENNMSMLKRFTRKVQESGVLRYSRSVRYAEREGSHFVKKKNRLNSIEKKADIEQQIKMGKIAPGRQGRRR